MRLSRPFLAALAAVCWPLLTAGSCAHDAAAPEPRIEIREVKIPVAVACAANPGPDPAFADAPDALRQAADVFERVKLLLAGRAQRDGRLAELKAATAGCR